MKSFKIAYLGLLGAGAITLSFLESLLPPLPFLPPGAKAGFSNIVTMFAAGSWGLAPALTLCILKSLFVLFTRGITAFCMSLAGGLFSTLIMWLCLRGRLSLIFTGIVGAVAHNTAQLGVAVVLTGTPHLFTYYPFLLLFALASGSITGVLLHFIYEPLSSLNEKLNLTQKGG
ncbi:MAG: Gx transporter family protein [Clostridia bacterium]|nr:Gx transporter family protein [Clostridia bacterium]